MTLTSRSIPTALGPTAMGPCKPSAMPDQRERAGPAVPTTSTTAHHALFLQRGLQFIGTLATMAIAITFAGCTTVPTFRAPVDLPLKDQAFEAGGGLQVLAGPNTTDLAKTNGANAGVGVQGFGVYRTPWPVDVFVMGHGAGTLHVFPAINTPGYIAGGQAGVRGRVEAIEGLIFSLEAYGDYLEQNIFGRALRHVSGMATVTVAENAYGPLWVYIRPTVGISIPLYQNPELPFFGLSEMPVGFSFDLGRNFAIRGEGGYHIPSGMISIGTAFVGTF